MLFPYTVKSDYQMITAIHHNKWQKVILRSSCCAAVEIHDEEQITMSPDAQVTDAHNAVSTPNLNDGHQSLWCGYKIVIDNVDKNF